MDAWSMLKSAADYNLSILDSVLRDAQEISGNASISPDDHLDSVLPNPGEVEHLILSQEQNYGVTLADGDAVYMFSHGTIADLASEISRRIRDKEKTEKTASDQRSTRHRWYMRNAPQLRAEARVYRMAHLMELRRKSRKYRSKVKRRLIRPRKRVGTASSGFSFVPR